MDEKIAEQSRFNWWLPLYAAVGAVFLFVPIMIYGSDIGEMLYMFVAAPLICLVLLVVAFFRKRQQSWAVLSMVAVYFAVSLGLFTNSHELHWTARWALDSDRYKAQVLAQPAAATGELKHIVWDKWGYAGIANTVVYLVFDPTDALAQAAKSRSPGKFSGIPCTVYRVRRLERSYYLVRFYADTDWGFCIQRLRG
jgi:hypothetical protein